MPLFASAYIQILQFLNHLCGPSVDSLQYWPLRSSDCLPAGLVPLRTFIWAWQFRQFSAHVSFYLSSLYFISLSMRMFWETVWRALLKFKWTPPTVLLLSTKPSGCAANNKKCKVSNMWEMVIITSDIELTNIWYCLLSFTGRVRTCLIWGRDRIRSEEHQCYWYKPWTITTVRRGLHYKAFKHLLWLFWANNMLVCF